MLVDLEWTLDNAHNRERTDWIKEFNTDNGHLFVVYEFPPTEKEEKKIWKRFVAERIHKGVYWAWDLWNDVENYTKWSVEHPYEAPKKIWDAMVIAHQSGDKVEHARLRDQLMRFKKEYGNADNFKQVFKYGHGFVNSKDPYVLQVGIKDVSGPDSDRYFDKNGGYIGKEKWIGNLKQVLHFQFHKLIDKRR